MAVSFALVLLFVLNGAEGTQIIGARDAVPHSRPYMASLQLNGKHFCGGMLVRDDFVLTSAYCAKQGLHVVLGAHNLLHYNTQQRFNVAKFIRYPTCYGQRNDIMLLKLVGKARLNRYVQVIPLKHDIVKEGSRCITAGWGEAGNNTNAKNLKEMSIIINPLKTCQRYWNTFPLTSSVICGTGENICQSISWGDLGGPLVCDGAAAGIASYFNHKGGFPVNPSAYTSISSFTVWIRRILSTN